MIQFGFRATAEVTQSISILFEVAGTVFYIPQIYFLVKTAFSLCQWKRCLTTCSQNWCVPLKKKAHYLSCRRYALLEVNLEEKDNVKRDSKIMSGKVKTVILIFLDFAKHLIWCLTKIYLQEIISVFTQKKSIVTLMKICLNCSKMCNGKWEPLEDWGGGQSYLGVLQALVFAFTHWQI